MSEYLSLRKELLNLKEKNVNLSPEIVSMVIKKKIKDKRTKIILLALLALSISIFLIFIFRRKS
ncbi:MAG: hypothetical protein QMD25_03160 [Caldisericia bacterium]|jgi:hypothetical protein|nr:hypothetical protein [Caldisericia bacterium]